MHKDLLYAIFCAPTSFFDTKPVGRIISCYLKDIITTMDTELVDYLDFVLFCSLSVTCVHVIIIFVTPGFAVACVPIEVVYFATVNYLRHVSRERKRIESVARSLVYAHFISETLGGLIIICAFNDVPRYVQANLQHLDRSIQAWYVMKGADRWLSVRLELVGSVITYVAAMLSW